MSVCSLCSTIPFESLPDPPSYQGFSRIGDQSECPALSVNAAQDGLYGFPWHHDLASLATASSSCPLCAIVQQGFQRWLGFFEESRRTEFYTEFKDVYDDTVPHGQRLFLTKRFGDGPGFLVFAKQPARRSSLCLLTGVVFSVSKENPEFHKLQLQPRDSDSGSLYSMTTVASFLTECDEKHEKCFKTPAVLPSRVLDTGLSKDVVKLVEPRGQSGIYACLSHCVGSPWGGEMSLATTQHTIRKNEAGIPLDDLPKTFLDAIQIVNQLGIRYIWIDSLCILQDDADDWARESARMHDVYSNAYLTIAANHARNPSEGCFNTRSPRPSCDVDLPGYASSVHTELLFVDDEMDWEHGQFLSEPLSRRGWALQERVLSQRILHYNTRQIYYECNHGLVGEDGCRQQRLFCSLDVLFGSEAYGADKNHETEPERSDKSNKNEMFCLWDSLVWMWGRRTLTKSTDRLPATSGLSKLFQKHLRCQYVAGFWSDSLIQNISWRALGDAKSPVQGVGPSWSWVSYPGIAGNHSDTPRRSIARVLEWQVDLKNKHNPYGEVNSAWLRIHGPLIPLLLAKVDFTENDLRRQKVGLQPCPQMRTPYRDDDEECLVEVEFDYEEIAISGRWRELELHLLVLHSSLPPHNSANETKTHGQEPTDEFDVECRCLVVACTDKQDPGRMKRVGLSWFYGPLVKMILEDQKNRREVILL
ncbi:heterokaryon incompatibility protein-domain-containing protein [Apiospora sp. TS-2023a]